MSTNILKLGMKWSVKSWHEGIFYFLSKFKKNQQDERTLNEEG